MTPSLTFNKWVREARTQPAPHPTPQLSLWVGPSALRTHTHPHSQGTQPHPQPSHPSSSPLPSCSFPFPSHPTWPKPLFHLRCWWNYLPGTSLITRPAPRHVPERSSWEAPWRGTPLPVSCSWASGRSHPLCPRPTGSFPSHDRSPQTTNTRTQTWEPGADEAQMRKLRPRTRTGGLRPDSLCVHCSSQDLEECEKKVQRRGFKFPVPHPGRSSQQAELGRASLPQLPTGGARPQPLSTGLRPEPTHVPRTLYQNFREWEALKSEKC